MYYPSGYLLYGATELSDKIDDWCRYHTHKLFETKYVQCYLILCSFVWLLRNPNYCRWQITCFPENLSLRADCYNMSMHHCLECTHQTVMPL